MLPLRPSPQGPLLAFAVCPRCICSSPPPKKPSPASAASLHRDPRHFPTILSFMRDGAAPVPTTRDDRLTLRAEAAYFGWLPLVAEMDAAEERHATVEVSGGMQGGEETQAGHQQLGVWPHLMAACTSRQHSLLATLMKASTLQ